MNVPRATPVKAKAGEHQRLAEVDSLRGLAALAVVMFHFTYQYRSLFSPNGWTGFEFTHGHYGVNLFFIISGFVIFMTLERTKVPMDFVVSRFSRLYPAYWFAVALTFFITQAFGLPGKLVDGWTALANGLMFHGFFHFAHVDGVYWTLEVELLFYCGMLLLFVSGRLRQVFYVAMALLALRWVYLGLEKLAGVDLPYIAFRLLILRYLPWFVLGLATYVFTQPSHRDLSRQAGVAAAFAVLTLAAVDGPLVALLSLVLWAAVLAAASGRLPILRWSPLAWFGAISYPLYLLHENIGWSLLLRVQAQGWNPWLSITLVFGLVVLLSYATTRLVEQPVMRWIRRRWRQRRKPALV